MSISSTIIPTAIDPTTLSPTGSIMMWHGLIANIPTGWVLCNGSNDTPDLRGRFIQGAADGSEANDPVPGGSATATPGNHTVTQPSTHAALSTHAHGTGHGTLSSWKHVFAASGGYGTTTNVTTTADAPNNYYGNSRTTAGMLTESIAAGTPNAHSGSAVDSHSTAASRPPFYTLLYIMKS